MKIPKQRHIDTGQIGGIIQIYTQSIGRLSILNFLGIASLFYDRFLRAYIPIHIGIPIIILLTLFWCVFDYVITTPSVIQFNQRQAYAHNSPVKKDFEKLNQKIDKLTEQLQEGLK